MLKDNKKIKRFVSLDVLRGITVVGMIMVNTQGVGNKFLFCVIAYGTAVA